MASILFYTNSQHEQEWLRTLHSALPQHAIRTWTPGDNAPADYAIVWKPPAEMLVGRSSLKAIFILGAGADAILQLGSALPTGVPIVRLDDAGMGVQMAEYVCHAVLRYFRRFDQYDAQRDQQQWNFLMPFEKNEFSVGVLGLGVLGQRIVDAVKQFEFPVLGWSRNPKHIDGVTCYAGSDGLDAFLRASRVVVCILPLTNETSGLLNQANLQKLPQGAYLVNVARGAHVNEDDLLALVQSGHIAGATLDVFRQEPLPVEHPFWREPRIQITPHMAAMSLFKESIAQIAEKIQALEHGLAIRGIVDPTKGY
ncbi:glyoxylate/hydroxypyruvate reductase A [Undibacterium jejuense]|uniref:Glyoxylate/hydroxypyruvate reductase A n=1 Tax=Undibacterium jejuense TaxID=1344949 RepID=A0A923HKN5_9BURK|nr:glyoxylate/hydroxypyruvate reductase A [Undibacterium jejuense]MBC3864035.1 glyoxylate/hydroxypyruvate reductase A [Undibacterium jejuense]